VFETLIVKYQSDRLIYRTVGSVTIALTIDGR
jgi:hypothetical protein